jgi:hypothetical protein
MTERIPTYICSYIFGQTLESLSLAKANVQSNLTQREHQALQNKINNIWVQSKAEQTVLERKRDPPWEVRIAISILV